ncbi:hypothetical protein I4U23_028544 [Adineta vaga]|nr:hypothetical protein I4U23_028544 [Adineta vaga]
MSDPNQISENLTNLQEDETIAMNGDESRMISISDQKIESLEIDTDQKCSNEIGNECDDKDDSEYEDLDDDEEEDDDGSLLSSVLKKALFKKTMDEDEVDIDIKPRRSNENHLEKEHSEGDDDNDNQSVPTIESVIVDDKKKSENRKETFDDDNDTQNPAYIPRKGRFYEHDDRTLDETNQSKKEITRNNYRLSTDFDGKWQHDLFLRDEEKSTFRRPLQKHDHEHSPRDYHQNRFHVNDYMSQSHTGYNNFPQQRMSHKTNPTSINNRMNQFDLKDYEHSSSSSSSYNRSNLKRETTVPKEVQVTPHRQRRDYDQTQIDERTYHRRRSLPTNDFQQQDNTSKYKNNFTRNDPKFFKTSINSFNQPRKTYELSENKPNLPPRLQMNNTNRNLIQKPSYQQRTSLNLSPDVSMNERPKRYSNMRNNMPNSSIHQQTLPLSQMQHYREQRSNKTEQNDWPQAPPPPTSYLPRQIITPQMFYQQQSSRYNQMASAQTSTSQQNFPSLVGGAHQRRLLQNLFKENNYDPVERPVYNDTDTLTVTMSLALQQIIDFDEKNEIIVISGWLTWHDYSLNWKPEEYGGIQSIRVPSTHVWTPDIYLYNSADDNFEGTMKTNLVVQHNGTILFVPPGILKSICPFNIDSFPFVSVNLTIDGDQGQLDAYVKNAEWELLSFLAVRKAVVYECCPTVYPFALFTIRIRRRTLYYVVNIVVPCVLISFMTILGFLLPPDSGEKLTLQITILLSIVMFSLLISGIIPASSTALPTIVMYFATVMCMCSMSVVATVLVLGFHHRNAKNHTMPKWISVYINEYLAWLLWMSRPGHDLTWRAIRRRHTRTHERENSTINNYKCLPTPSLAESSKSLLANVTCLNDPNFTNTSQTLPSTVMNHILPRQHSKCKNPTHNHEPNDVLLPRDMRVFRAEMRTIITELQFLTEHVKQEEEDDDVSEDWKFSAMVIDRLCLVLFTLMTTIFSYVTLFSAPNFFKLR